jgi:hypothetical protein
MRIGELQADPSFPCPLWWRTVLGSKVPWKFSCRFVHIIADTLPSVVMAAVYLPVRCALTDTVFLYVEKEEGS